MAGALCSLLALTTVAGCTYYQTVAAAPSGPSAFDRSWDAALGAADDPVSQLPRRSDERYDLRNDGDRHGHESTLS
jgi:hypothetical protein